MQGGKANIEAEGVKSFAVVNVDSNLFKKSLDMGIINENQVEMLEGFYSNPDETRTKVNYVHPNV